MFLVVSINRIQLSFDEPTLPYSSLYHKGQSCQKIRLRFLTTLSLAKFLFVAYTFAIETTFLPALNRQIPAPKPVPGTVADENATEEGIEPEIQPLNDYEEEGRIKE